MMSYLKEVTTRKPVEDPVFTALENHLWGLHNEQEGDLAKKNRITKELESLEEDIRIRDDHIKKVRGALYDHVKNGGATHLEAIKKVNGIGLAARGFGASDPFAPAKDIRAMIRSGAKVDGDSNRVGQHGILVSGVALGNQPSQEGWATGSGKGEAPLDQPAVPIDDGEEDDRAGYPEEPLVLNPHIRVG